MIFSPLEVARDEFWASLNYLQNEHFFESCDLDEAKDLVIECAIAYISMLQEKYVS